MLHKIAVTFTPGPVRLIRKKAFLSFVRKRAESKNPQPFKSFGHSPNLNSITISAINMTPSLEPLPKKTQKRSYTTAFKKEVITYYEEHKNTASFLSVSKHFNVPLPTVKAFYKRRNTVLNTGDNKKRNRQCFFPELEQDLLKFVKLARSTKLPVTGGLLLQKAKMLRSKHNIEPDHFKVSRGWLQRFLERSNMGNSVRLYCQAGSVDVNGVQQEMVDFCRKLTKYEPGHIYNEDESGFLYQLLPNITYLSPCEDRKEVRGVKAMKEKHRLTFCVCSNATGSHILPLFVIGKSANPRAFAFATKDDDVKRCYRSQHNSWMTGDLFEYYITSIWYPEIRKRTSENVCLIVDNCSAHGAALPSLNGVEYIPLPPNVTSVYQPMDQGIIRALKTHARADLLRQIVETIDNREELRQLGYRQTPGMRGLQYAHGAHVLDAIQILNRSLKKITAKTVVNCWIHSKILSKKQIIKCCNLIGKQNPDFSKLENSPGLEGEFFSFVGPYRSTVMDEIEEDLDEESNNSNPTDSVDSSSCVDEELVIEAESLVGLFARFIVDENGRSENHLAQRNEILKWLQNLSIEEESIGKTTDRDPSSLLEYLNTLEAEQDSESRRQEEAEVEKAMRENETRLPRRAEQYNSACETVKWLEEILAEAEKREVHENVRANLINTLRSALAEHNKLAPSKKQNTIVDFFSTN